MRCATQIPHAASSAGISPWRSTPESPSPDAQCDVFDDATTGGRAPRKEFFVVEQQGIIDRERGHPDHSRPEMSDVRGVDGRKGLTAIR
jgi:hypothetical protein